MIRVGDLIGLPFVYGGRGPNSYDCYGLVMECWRRAYGGELPEVTSFADLMMNAITAGEEMKRWQQVDEQPGAVALFNILGHNCHVGFVLRRDEFIHAFHTAGVERQRLSEWRRRLVGFYRYTGPQA